MDVFRYPQDDEIRSRSSQSERDLSFWVSRIRSHLALQAASLLLFFFFILLSLRVEFYVFSVSFFSFNVGRTHMFILCNGIVAILVKDSVLAESQEDGEAKKEMKNDEVILKDDEISVENLVGTEKTIVSIKEEEEEEKDQEIVGECVLVAETEQIDLQLVEDELQEEERKEEDGFEELSVEELNKKCDEFIRRMRRVISNGNTSL